MVNKQDKNEGAKKAATTTAPKRRIATATKPKAATRIAEAAPAAKSAIKKAAKLAAKPAVAQSIAPTVVPAVATSVVPSAIRQEDVAFRAYLIGEKRQQLGLPGDSLSDWVEAERQLLSERATHGVN